MVPMFTTDEWEDTKPKGKRSTFQAPALHQGDNIATDNFSRLPA